MIDEPAGLDVARRGDVWVTNGGTLLVVLQVDALGPLTTVVGAVVVTEPSGVGEPLRVPVGAGEPAAWVKTNVIVTVERAELVRRIARLGGDTLERVGSAVARVLGVDRRAAVPGPAAVSGRA
ncbi:MAG: type II toxin-antitoxin system PemK/MazF family toxin [Acidimicrobiales bacterium]